MTFEAPRYIECDCGIEVGENDANEKMTVRASACLSIDGAIRMTYPVGFVSSWIKCRRKSGCNTRLEQYLQHYFNIKAYQ